MKSLNLYLKFEKIYNEFFINNRLLLVSNDLLIEYSIFYVFRRKSSQELK